MRNVLTQPHLVAAKRRMQACITGLHKNSVKTPTAPDADALVCFLEISLLRSRITPDACRSIVLLGYTFDAKAAKATKSNRQTVKRVPKVRPLPALHHRQIQN